MKKFNIIQFLVILSTGLLLNACGVVEDAPPAPPFISGTIEIDLYTPNEGGSVSYATGEFSWYDLTDSDAVFLLGVFTSEPTGTVGSGLSTTNLIAYGISDGPGVNPTSINLNSGDVLIDELYEYNTTDGFTLNQFTTFSAGTEHHWAIWGIKNGEVRYSSQARAFTLNN